MKWTYKNFAGAQSIIGPEEAVRLIVDNAPDYHAGTVESLAARHDKLMQIVGTMLEFMPENVQRAIVEEHGHYMKEVP